MKKIPGNLLKNLEKSWKYHGILSVRKSGNPACSALDIVSGTQESGHENVKGNEQFQYKEK